jgi:hypothetical protein
MKQPIEEKAAQPGSRGGDGNGTVSQRRPYPTRSKGASPYAEPWRPVRIGDLVDKALKNILRDGVQS